MSLALVVVGITISKPGQAGPSACARVPSGPVSRAHVPPGILADSVRNLTTRRLRRTMPTQYRAIRHGFYIVRMRRLGSLLYAFFVLQSPDPPGRCVCVGGPTQLAVAELDDGQLIAAWRNHTERAALCRQYQPALHHQMRPCEPLSGSVDISTVPKYACSPQRRFFNYCCCFNHFISPIPVAAGSVFELVIWGGI